jgi:hypothetical protein
MALFWDAAPRVASPELALAPGQTFMPAAGWYWYKPSSQSNVQRFDPIANIWRFSGDDARALKLHYFDGRTTRIANTSGCVVAASVTTAGSGYATATPPAVTASAGGSLWTAIVGGAISTAAVIAVAGSGYTYPPILWIEQPPQPGVQAAGTITIANGTISAVTITDQGAGYLAPPNTEVLNDWRDITGYNGQVALALTGAGTITAAVCNDHGNPITSGTVPTLAFGSGAAAATAVMDWAVRSVSVTTAGAGYTSSAGAATATAAGGYVSATPAYLGGFSSTGMSRWREAKIDLTTNSSGGLASVAAIIDSGHYQGIPTPAIYAAQPPSTTGVLALTMGGVNATIFLMPAQQ